MTAPPLLQRLFDTGAQFTEMSQKHAEKAVAEFVKAGDLRRKDAEKAVQHLVERGRATTEHVISLIQAEVSKQLGRFALRLDDVESRIEEVAGNLGFASKSPAHRKAAGPSGVAKVTARKASVKRAPAKKAAAKKAAAKKAPAKKAAAKKAPAKQ
jgi:polyhydroxyalkanoate synthesis regulator phasin